MSAFDKSVFNLINFLRNRNSLKIINNIGSIDNHNLIIPNLYLGNIQSAHDISFLESAKIDSIINCTKDETFHPYFEKKKKLRLILDDSREKENLDNFKKNIINGIKFIDNEISLNKTVYVHCYWGLMRSATVVAGYLIYKYNLKKDDAILLVKDKRPMALSSIYNFNEVLDYIENNNT
jgi:hypothetical protein